MELSGSIFYVDKIMPLWQNFCNFTTSHHKKLKKAFIQQLKSML